MTSSDGAPAPAVIVNADDLGLAACVNRGIVRAHREGLVTSATLLANGPAFDDAVARLAGCPDLGVGVHLNLVRGKPLLPPVQVGRLVGPDGRFAPARLFRAAKALGGRGVAAHLTELFDFAERPGRQTLSSDPRWVLADAAKEYRAQIARVIAAGIRPTHVDFEQHHGRRPALYVLARALARAAGIHAMRRYREPCWWAWRRGGFPDAGRAWRAAMLRTYHALWRPERAFDETAPEMSYPDHFLGQSWIGVFGAGIWRRLLASGDWPRGVTEVMVHPGEYDPEEMARLTPEIGASWMHPCRPAELAGATDPDAVARWRELARPGGPLRAAHFGLFPKGG